MQIVEVPELGTGREVLLGPKERRSLRRLAGKLDVAWLDEERARISAAGYVGTVRLSDRLTVSVRTKVPVDNLLRLASLAYRGRPRTDAVGEAELAEGGPLDWLAFLLVLEVERLLAGSIRQGHVEVEEELPYVRGRIRFDSAIRTWARPGVLPCAFADLLPDTPENRVLRSTLEALAAGPILPWLRARALDAASRLAGVTLVPASLRLLEAVRWTRLNQHYRPALELCRLFLEGRGVEEPTGPVLAPSFLFPMEEVFERAVANHLRAVVPGVTVQPPGALTPRAGAPAHTLGFRPDVLIEGPGARVALDTKWADPEYRRAGRRSFRNPDVYQVAFYATVYGGAGLLIYPRADRDVWVSFDLGGVRCDIVTVDLRTPELGGLDALDAAVRELLAARP